MQAGRLNEVISLYETVTVQNDYGEKVKTERLKLTTRAYVPSQSGSRRIDNDEIFYYTHKTFQVRRYVDVQNTDVIEWQGNRYRIISVTDHREWNNKVIEAELINT